MPRRILAVLAVALLAVVPASAAAGGRRGAKRGAPAATSRRAPPEVNLKSDDAAASAPAPSTGSASSSSGAPPQRGPTRIDFDDRLIQGQTNKSGAVYLYDRKELKQRSMVKVRQSFREEILKTVYDR